MAAGDLTENTFWGPEPLRRCCERCKVIKPLGAFGTWTAAHTPVKRRRRMCKECRALLQRAAEHANPAKYSRSQRHLISKYNLSPEEYAALLKRQGGLCALCRRPERVLDCRRKGVRRLAVDHDHATRKVRGLLCHACNVMIGHADHDPALLRAAADYLDRFAT